MLTIPLNVELQKMMDTAFVEPSPPTPFSWFHNLASYPVRPEDRNGNTYWYMRKMIDGQKYVVYVAPEGKLTAELLNNAASQIEADASPVKP